MKNIKYGKTGTVHRIRDAIGGPQRIYRSKFYDSLCGVIACGEAAMPPFNTLSYELTSKKVTCRTCLRLLGLTANSTYARNPKLMESSKRANMYKQALEDIRDLAIGYDGFNTMEGLKSLIDDMQNITVKALSGKEWCTHIPPTDK